MDSNNIMSPRPFFDMDEEPGKGVVRIKLGSKSNGIFIDITKNGITFNGYYKGRATQEKRYACLLRPAEIKWDDLEKMKQNAVEASKPKRRKKETAKKKYTKQKCAAHYDDPNFDKKYLETLPKVTLNNEKFYIDTEKKERRPVSDPTKVYKY